MAAQAGPRAESALAKITLEIGDDRCLDSAYDRRCRRYHTRVVQRKKSRRVHCGAQSGF